jgi:hypothetical protein
MIRIEHHSGALWGIRSTAYSKVLREECKKTPGLRWEPTTRSWIGYADGISIAAKRARARGLIIQGEIPKNGVTTLLIAEKDLRPYQVEGVRFLVAKAGEGALLADELAMGKTIQAIRGARAFKGKTIVVCPSFVRGVWRDEIAKWWPDATAVFPTGTKPIVDSYLLYPLTPTDIVVIHYDILYAWTETLIAWGPATLILDEFQYCQGAGSRRTKACSDIARYCRYRIALTGTPPLEKTKNLWAAVNVISEGRFGEKAFGFFLHHCAAHQEQVTPTKTVWKFDGSSNLDELNERLVYSDKTPWGFMLRRLKSEVTLQLPDKQRQILELEVPHLGQNASIAYAVKNDRMLRAALNVTADGKIPQVIDLVIGHIEAGHKVVVGSYRKAIAHAIAEGVAQKIPTVVGVVDGDLSLNKREAVIKSQPNLLCCTFDSTAVGINLSFASVGVVAELDYTPSKLIQWEGRFGRQAGRDVLIQYCVARGSADELVKRVCLQKLDRFQEAIGKVDNKLKEDLRGLEGPNAVDRLKLLYEQLLADDD